MGACCLLTICYKEFLGTGKGVFKTPKRVGSMIPMVQVLVSWQWSQHLHRQARQQGNVPLLLNLDETSVPVVFTHAKGNMMVCRGPAAWRTLPNQRCARSTMRMFFTHVGIICNDPAIQPLLPQVIFVGAHSITQAQWTAVTSDLPSNVYVKRMPKGWNNAAQHRVIIRILGLILQPFLETRQPILSFDAAPLHLHDGVLEEFIAARIWFMVIPARLTWMMQPLDTHGFVLYKNWLRRHFIDALAEGDERPSMRRMLELVIGAIRHVLQGRRWQKAFDQNGFGEDLSTVSSFIRHQIGVDSVPLLPNECPSVAQLQLCWPRNRVFNEELVMRSIPNEMLALADAPVPALGLAEMAMVPLPAPPGASLLVAALAAGPAAHVLPLPDLVHSTPGAGSSAPADPGPDSIPVSLLPAPKRRLYKKTSLEHIL